MRGIRGAICARENSRKAIFEATQHLLQEILRRNELVVDDIVAAFFTMTPDLNADFPAYAARDLGWSGVPMLGAQESQVPRGQERAIRVLLLCRGEGGAKHVYLGRASAMRPDLTLPGDAETWNGATSGPAAAGEAGVREPLGRLLVVGLGLIGGSLAAAARARRLCTSVRGYDADPASRGRAVRVGLVEAASESLQKELALADLVVIATPVRQVVKLLDAHGGDLKPGCVVTDVGSTKTSVVAAMGRLPATLKAVGGHPMTGKTESGVTAAAADLFTDCEWALVPTPRTDEAAMRTVERLVAGLGARPRRMSAEMHDQIVAVTSHLPVLLATGLVGVAGSVGEDGRVPLAGPGFSSATRLAGGEPEMTAQMLADNAEHVAAAVEAFRDRLDELVRALGSGEASLRDRLTEARAARDSLLGS